MRRSDRDAGRLFGVELLKSCQYATLMTVAPDGTPYGVPISHVFFNDAVYFHCAPEGQKLRNILRNPAVCLCCVGQTQPVPDFFTLLYESVIAKGTAEIVLDVQEKRDALLEISRKYAQQNLNQAPDFIDRLIDRTQVVKIHLESITAKANKNVGK